MDVDQTRMDLDNLQGRVAVNWASYKNKTANLGKYQCIYHSMCLIVGLDDLLTDRATREQYERCNGMIKALGFHSEPGHWDFNNPEYDGAGYQELFDWNDAQTSNEPVLQRIKAALERLG